MEKTSRIRVLTVDDHPLLQEGLAAVIRRQQDMEMVGEAASGAEGIRLFRDEVLDDAPSSSVVEELRSPLRRATQLLSQVANEGRIAVRGLRSAPAREDLAQFLYRAAEEQPHHAGDAGARRTHRR